VVLTEAGRLLSDYARQIFALSDEARRALEELRGLERGRLAVGASTTIGVYLLPAVMGRFHQRHPALELSLEIGNTDQVVGRLRAGALDLALVEGPVEADDLTVTPFLEDRLALIVAPDHPFAAAGCIEPSALANVPFLAREPGSGTRAVVEAALARQGVEPQVAMALGHTEAIKQAVAANLGVSILSRLTVARELADGVLAEVVLEGLAITRHFRIVTRARSRPSSAARAFLALLTEQPE
jgi:DNA-binding transcriptional LysR family regulator